MIRIDKKTNIFNLIKNKDSTIDDFKKLYDISPEKFTVTSEDYGNILEHAENYKRNDLLEYFNTLNLDIDYDEGYIIYIFYDKAEKVENALKNIDLRKLSDEAQEQIINIINSMKETEKILRFYLIFNNPKGAIDINKEVKISGIKTPLIFLFTKREYLNILKDLVVKLHPNLNATRATGETILIYIFQNKNYEAAKFVLENGLDINKKVNGYTYMKYIYTTFVGDNNNKKKYLKLLVDHGLGIDTPVNNNNYSFLMMEIGNNNKELFDFLIDNGADINHSSSDLGTPLGISLLSNTTYFLKKLIEKGADVNKPIKRDQYSLLQLAIANFKLPLDIIKLILDSGANKEYKDLTVKKTALELANQNYNNDKEYYGKVIELLGGEILKTEKWKGFSRSDIEKFDIFFEKPFDWSCCPICLEYVERSDGCMYMAHDCAKTKHYYHKKLYDKFAYHMFQGSPKKVEWCTVCGRITENHKHYKLSVAEEPSKEKAVLNPEIQARLDRGDNFAFFDNANCIGFGGGGTEEKTARFRRLREYALELQEEVDKKEQDDILQELVEEVWNAPLIRNRKIKKILEDKKWNINVKEFPENKKNNTAKNNNANAPNIQFNGTKPTIVDDDCIILAEDDDANTQETNPKFHFHHETVGGIDHNGIYICQKDLAKAIEIKNAEFGLEDFGKCWWDQCEGVLHPEELKGIIPEVLYNDYRKKFNKKMAQKGGTRKDKKEGKKERKRKTRKINNQYGGNIESVLYELSDGTCSPHNWTRDGKLRNLK